MIPKSGLWQRTRDNGSGGEMGQDVIIPAHDGGRFSCYLAAPPAPGAPGLVLIQYICGVNRVMRMLADEFAENGMLVAVPDLFWRQQPGVALNNDPANPDPEDHKKALSLNAGFDDANGVADLRSTLAWLKARPECSGKAGVLGYCLGGRLAYLMAARSDADCSVGYYGVNINRYLREADQIKNPLLLHIAGRDELCPAEAQREIAQALETNPVTTVHVYAQAGHAFALPGGHNFNAATAQEANRRSLQFLRQVLVPSPLKVHAAAPREN
jgi:carboxymethylenebutenolidase